MSDPEPMTGAVLALETSTRSGSVALRPSPGAPTVVQRLDSSASHGRDLVPALDGLVRDAGLAPGDVGLVVVGRGPGSYTGLRVSAATALGLARASDAELVGVPSFEALALEALQPGERGAVVRDAFGGAAYVAVHERDSDGTLSTRVPAACARVSDALELIGAVDVVLGDTAIAHAVFGADGPPVRSAVPSAAAVLALGLAARAEDRDASDVSPLYLRAFEAKVRTR
ncbi:MAG: tRNA (adenosine(37)-N6)-threonylcarbamoyltransferase complex dimerization subunit type 1 TsaB [Planctomycetota bacterium]